MTIAAKLNDEMKTAMRAKQADRVACIRSVKAKVQEAENAKGFTGEVDDALYEKTIGAYVKMLKKALPELEAGGERGAVLAGQYQAEISYLETYLPKMLDEAATRAIVDKVVAELGVSEPKDAGRVMGAVMKTHRDEVDAGLVRKVVDAVLAG